MIAEVYPLRRVSRTMGVLDYQVPSNLKLARGALVQIPLRQKKIYGIVCRIKEKPLRGIRLKSILSIVNYGALSNKELSFFESVSASIVQPTSNLLYTYIPVPVRLRDTPMLPISKSAALTIPQHEAPTISRIALQLTKQRRAFATAPDLRRSAAIISGFLHLSGPQKTLIVCPHIHDVNLLSEALAKHQPLFLTGNESRGQRYRVWQTFRQHTSGMLITTRAGMFYADESIGTIFVIKSGHPDHVLHDRNPRIDTRIAMQTLSEAMFTRLYFLDAHPRPEDLTFFEKEAIYTYPLKDDVQFIDLHRERPASAHPVLTSTCLSVIEETLSRSQRVFLIYNQKGYAHRLRCSKCNHPIICMDCTHPVRLFKTTVQCIHCQKIDPIPFSCPACKSTSLTARGYGIDRLAEAVTSFFPNTHCQIIDKDHTELPVGHIVIATRMYLEHLFDPFKKEHAFGAVIHLDPDTSLFSPDFRASHRAIWSLAQWRGFAHSIHAPFFVQTSEPDWFAKRLLHTDQTVLEELNQRREYHQPPFKRWITVRLEEEEPRKKELELHRLKESILCIPQTHVSVDAFLLIKFPESARKLIFDLFSTLDDRYIIDMHAYQG